MLGFFFLSAHSLGAPSQPPANANDRDYPTKLATWVEEHQADVGQNRWQEFVEAATSLCASWEFFALENTKIAKRVEADADRKYADPLALLDDPATGEEFIPELRRFFATLDKSQLMFRLDDLTQPSRFVALRAVEPLLATSQPELGKLRLGVKLCAARMRLAAIDGKPEQVERSLEHALAMASGSQGRGLLIGYLSANASWATLEREVRGLVLDGRLNSDACRDVLKLLTDRPTPDPRIALGGERFFALESVELFFEKAEEERAVAKKAGRESPALDGLVPREEQIKQANRFFDAADKTLSDDSKERAAAEAEVRAVGEVVAQKDPVYKPVAALLPAIEQAARAARTFAVHHAGTRTMLALEAFRGRSGHYPEALVELVPGDLESLPDDPFAPGQPLRYKRVEAEGGKAPTAYLLYSVGTDGVDNQGKAHPGNRASALGPASSASGYDYVINAK